MFLVLMTTQFIFAQNWYDAGWSYRSSVSVPNPGSVTLTDFQVQVQLNSGNFDFSRILSDGSDIRITANDGTTLIPFWIESLSSASASIWVKVPSLPVAGTTIYLYYGNSAPTIPPPGPAVETPPVGPFTRAEGNPVVPSGDPLGGIWLLAENIVYDAVTARYWMVFASYRDAVPSVGLLWSTNPTDPASWNWYSGNPVITQANAPHIMESGGTWYIFFDDLSAPSPGQPISFVSSTTGIDGTYSARTAVLPAGAEGSWEDFRVSEPYVFFNTNNNLWYIVYMGDAGDDEEQVGYATSTDLTGQTVPYTKYTGNPILANGDSYDHGIIADPWVYESQGVYYIGNTVSPQHVSPWQTAVATTTNWTDFTKRGIILPLAESGDDAMNSFRGAVTRIGNNYVFAYTRGYYSIGIATQPVFMSEPAPINNPEKVFDFYDGFDGSVLNRGKWAMTEGAGNPVSLSGGVISMNSGTYKTRILGNTPFAMDVISETRAQHLDQGTPGNIMQVGFVNDDFAYSTRIVDGHEDNLTHWQRQARDYWDEPVVTMNQTADVNWHVFSVYRQSPGTAGFRIDNNPFELQTSGVPTRELSPYLDSYGTDNDINVDWIRVRKWAGSDPVTVVGTAENAYEWTGGSSSDWNVPGNWNLGIVPSSGSNVVIAEAAIDPVITGLTACNSLIVEAAGNMVIGSTGSLTVNGTLNNAGSLTIESAGVASSGSLIVNGVSSGNVTYNRAIPDDGETDLWHYISTPVSPSSITTTKEFYPYDEVAGNWGAVIADPDNLAGGIQRGIGYTVIGGGSITFEGTLLNEDLAVTVTSPYYTEVGTGYPADPGSLADYDARWASGRPQYGGGGFNLLGNPYTSSLNIERFLARNGNLLDPYYQAVYLFNGSSYNYIGNPVAGWDSGNPEELTSQTAIQTGQGFYVLAEVNNTEVVFTKSMQEHNSTAILLKSAGSDNRWPGLRLSVQNGENKGSTLIIYNKEMSAGLDEGYDVGLISSGADIEVYSRIPESVDGVNMARQALPEKGAARVVIPLGIDFAQGGNVTFSADAEPLKNLRFWLEDRSTGTFTDLGSGTYSVALPSNTSGTGRFFMHVLANRSNRPRTPNENSSGLKIWSTQDNLLNIQGIVSDKAVCRVYDNLGREIFLYNLKGGDYNTFRIPSGGKGVYLVQVTDGNKVSTQRLVLL